MPLMSISLDDILKQLEYLPEPPNASMQAVSMLEDSKYSLSQVAEFITLDECLTTKLLKMANSVAYANNKQAYTAREAMSKLGTSVVKSLLFSSMIDSTGLSASPYFAELWKSALFTAMLARDLGSITQHPKAELCFSVGLLSDVGQLLFNEYAPDLYQGLLKKVQAEGQVLSELEAQLFGFTHADVGSEVAFTWKLPQLYKTVIRYHHEPQVAQPKLLRDDYRLLLIVHVANQMSPWLGNQSGAGVDMEALQKGGFNLSFEQMLQVLQTRQETYLKDIEQISQVMFNGHSN